MDGETRSRPLKGPTDQYPQLSRDVWAPARHEVFAEGNPLREVRRHDLRHSAMTAWLNNGVLLKTSQRWSGHRSFSVLLDTYAGVMRDDATISLARVSGGLPVTGW
jgi:integrase